MMTGTSHSHTLAELLLLVVANLKSSSLEIFFPERAYQRIPWWFQWTGGGDCHVAIWDPCVTEQTAKPKKGYSTRQDWSWFSSVTQSFLTLWDPKDCSMPGFPVHHQLLELAQTHVHLVSDAIQPSHPLSSPSSPAFNLPQHQGLF